MQGVIFFSHYSLELKSITSAEEFMDKASFLTELIKLINATSYSRVAILKGWIDATIEDQGIYEYLLEVVSEGDTTMAGTLLSMLYDKTLLSCTEVALPLEGAIQNIANKVPTTQDPEYYGALIRIGNWPNLSDEFHIRCKNTLNKFMKFSMASHPISEKLFAELCGEIFTNIIFHKDFSKTLLTLGKASGKTTKVRKRIGKTKDSTSRISGIVGFSKSVIKSLEALNNATNTAENNTKLYARLKSETTFDASGGKAQNFTFANKSVNCGHHIKINKSNNAGDGEVNARLYFGYLNENNNRTIYVAHCGCHLN